MKGSGGTYLCPMKDGCCFNPGEDLDENAVVRLLLRSSCCPARAHAHALLHRVPASSLYLSLLAREITLSVCFRRLYQLVLPSSLVDSAS